MTGYDFHPEAEADLNEIWGYIAAENVNAADRVMANIHRALENLVPFPFWTSGGSTRSVNGPGLNRIVR